MTSRINALLVEDDKNLGVILKKYLEAKGIPVTLCSNGEDALNTFKNGKFNFCILDVMMPLMDGFTLSQEIKKLDKKVPIIFLTAKTTQQDVLTGFNLGADDYITKPFSNKELVARIRALLRRTNRVQEDSTLIVDNLVMNLEARTVEIKGKEIKLRPKEFDLLHMFLLKPNNVLTREFILENVFEYNVAVTTRTIDTHIKNLRQALGSWGDKIKTIFGRGFKFVPDSK